jgi:hypothetical protein
MVSIVPTHDAETTHAGRARIYAEAIAWLFRTSASPYCFAADPFSGTATVLAVHKLSAGSPTGFTAADDIAINIAFARDHRGGLRGRLGVRGAHQRSKLVSPEWLQTRWPR